MKWKRGIYSASAVQEEMFIGDYVGSPMTC